MMTLAAVEGNLFSQRREKQRVFVVRAVLFIFLLSLLEGAFRKWFLPELATPLTLLRDPFVIFLYAYCTLNGLILTRGLAVFWMSFAFLSGTLGLLQYLFQGYGPADWVLGVRTYWLYMPLAFVVAKTFRREDVQTFLRLALYIAVPYAVLVATQYNAPSYAMINLGVGSDDSSAVGLGYGIVRPFGLFTYTGPNVQYTAATLAIFVAFYTCRMHLAASRLFLLITAVAVATMTVLTGSRSIFFLAGAILGVTLIGLLLARPTSRSLRRTVGLLAFVVLGAVLLVFAFPDMMGAMVYRFERAEAAEGSIWLRAYGELFAFWDAFYTASLAGKGIGAGAPGVARYIGLPSLVYGESDMQRNLNELGLLVGSFMLLLRYLTAIWLVRLAYGLAQRGEGMALPLVGFTLIPFVAGQITHSPLSAFLPWLFVGFILALTRSVVSSATADYDAKGSIPLRLGTG